MDLPYCLDVGLPYLLTQLPLTYGHRYVDVHTSNFCILICCADANNLLLVQSISIENVVQRKVYKATLLGLTSYVTNREKRRVFLLFSIRQH